ncbi:MAG: family 10 glycosylhydrolase [Bacteroidota bacterium]
MRNLILLFFLVSSFHIGQAQNENLKREFRGVWVATVVNIDYPPKAAKNKGVQKYEYIRMLEDFEKMGINAVIFQVRPAADAFYKSSYEPWSAYLTGTQGLAPEPDNYDPLTFMIEEAHARGMEFHAWLNPYRATFNLDTAALADQHVYYQHKDWLIPYGKRYYFKPHKAEVRDHITKVIAELTTNYDLDGIHFDDYFYPYKIKGLPFPDSLDFEKTKGANPSLEDWRRQNVDLLIQQVSEKIKAIKPHVQFGISPFGVWRNRSDDPVFGSNTLAGQTCYDDLYADVLKWLRNEWIDYVMPQLYWHIGFSLADHKTLVDWWAQNAFGRNLYIGHAAYKVGDTKNIDWLNPSEIPAQIRLNRATFNTQGSVYFSAKSIRNNPLNLADSLAQFYKHPVLLPEMKFLNLEINKAPNLKKVKMSDYGLKISWHGRKKKGGFFSFLRKAKAYKPRKKPYYYVVYKFEGNKMGDIEDAKNILQITEFDSKQNYTIYDPDYEEGGTYTYYVTGVNRQHTEGGFSNRRTVEVKKGKAKKRK